MIVHDVDRPDVGGVPAKMLPIHNTCLQELQAPFLRINTDDNLCSSVVIKGSFEPPDQWTNGIWQNSRYFMFRIVPMKGKRYYDPADVKVTVELSNKSYKLAKFRKYTGTPEKCIAKIKEWIKAQ